MGTICAFGVAATGASAHADVSNASGLVTGEYPATSRMLAIATALWKRPATTIGATGTTAVELDTKPLSTKVRQRGWIAFGTEQQTARRRHRRAEIVEPITDGPVGTLIIVIAVRHAGATRAGKTPIADWPASELFATTTGIAITELTCGEAEFRQRNASHHHLHAARIGIDGAAFCVGLARQRTEPSRWTETVEVIPSGGKTGQPRGARVFRIASGSERAKRDRLSRGAGNTGAPSFTAPGITAPGITTRARSTDCVRAPAPATFGHGGLPSGLFCRARRGYDTRTGRMHENQTNHEDAAA